MRMRQRNKYRSVTWYLLIVADMFINSSIMLYNDNTSEEQVPLYDIVQVDHKLLNDVVKWQYVRRTSNTLLHGTG